MRFVLFHGLALDTSAQIVFLLLKTFSFIFTNFYVIKLLVTFVLDQRKFYEKTHTFVFHVLTEYCPLARRNYYVANKEKITRGS